MCAHLCKLRYLLEPIWNYDAKYYLRGKFLFRNKDGERKKKADNNVISPYGLQRTKRFRFESPSSPCKSEMSIQKGIGELSSHLCFK